MSKPVPTQWVNCAHCTKRIAKGYFHDGKYWCDTVCRDLFDMSEPKGSIITGPRGKKFSPIAE